MYHHHKIIILNTATIAIIHECKCPTPTQALRIETIKEEYYIAYSTLAPQLGRSHGRTTELDSVAALLTVRAVRDKRLLGTTCKISFRQRQ